MKKLNAFILLIVVFLSVFIITFFGQAVSMDQFKVLLTYISITTYDEKLYELMNQKYLIYKYNPDIDNTIRIEYEQGPQTATSYNDLPTFSLVGDVGQNEDGTSFKKAVVNKYGEVTLLYCSLDEPSSIIVNVETNDGSRLKDSLTINWIMDKK